MSYLIVDGEAGPGKKEREKRKREVVNYLKYFDNK